MHILDAIVSRFVPKDFVDCSGSLRRGATRGNVRRYMRWSDVAKNPLARTSELSHCKLYQFYDKMVGTKYRYWRNSRILTSRPTCTAFNVARSIDIYMPLQGLNIP